MVDPTSHPDPSALAEPSVGDDGVPWCAEEKCRQYDGKRCRLLGFRPSTICEPAVANMAAELASLRQTQAGAVHQAQCDGAAMALEELFAVLPAPLNTDEIRRAFATAAAAIRARGKAGSEADRALAKNRPEGLDQSGLKPYK